MASADIETVVDLVRHGESEGSSLLCGRLDDQLTRQGWMQLEHALRGQCRWDVVISSPLDRCARFARAFAERLQRPLEIESSLREMRFGQWEGHSAAAILARDRERLTAFWKNPCGYAPPQGETLRQFQARTLQGWHQLTKCYAGQRVLMILHAGTLRVIVGEILCMPLESILRLEVPPAAVSRVRLQSFADGEASISLVFHNGHL